MAFLMISARSVMSGLRPFSSIDSTGAGIPAAAATSYCRTPSLILRSLRSIPDIAHPSQGCVVQSNEPNDNGGDARNDLLYRKSQAFDICPSIALRRRLTAFMKALKLAGRWSAENV